jgi:hypothetical protein
VKIKRKMRIKVNIKTGYKNKHIIEEKKVRIKIKMKK